MLRIAAPRVIKQKCHGVGTLRKPSLGQYRTFLDLNIFGAPKPDRKEADLDPGIDVMMDLVKRQTMSARLPSHVEVRRAVFSFVKVKYDQGPEGVIEDTQAELLLQAVRYAATDESRPGLSWVPVYRLSNVLTRRPKQVSNAHVELARTIYEDDLPPMRHLRMLAAYCHILCFTGRPEQARELLLQYRHPLAGAGLEENQGASSEDRQQDHSSLQKDDMGLEEDLHSKEKVWNGAERKTLWRGWKIVLETFALQRDEPQLLDSHTMARERGHTAVWDLDILLRFYIAQDDAPQAERMWKEYWTLVSQKGNHGPDGRIAHLLLRWCAAHKHLDLGHEVARDVLTGTPPKSVWDAIFVWAAATGKSVDEIGRMLDVMEASTQDGENRQDQLRPDTGTINGLVEMAISKGDPYMAERFLSLGKDRGIHPDAETFVLQIDYRLSVDDVDGALTAYKNLQAIESSFDHDIPAINRLIVALCDSKVHDFDTVMNVAADLSDRRARFEPATVSKLTLVHLDRDEIPDVIDLLNTHAFHYSSAERATIRDALIVYTLDNETPAARAWDSYMITREVFDEVPRELRTRIMSAFLDRKRADIAVHVFNHMRNHTRADTIPDVSTYAAAFTGVAKLRDLDSLELIHNQLKLDYNINLNTYLRNTLLAAYTACGKPRKGLAFWDDMVSSREGPSYNSIHLALRASEISPFGAQKAQDIWLKLRSRNVQLDNALWASYVAALNGNGDVRLAISTLEEAETQGELEVNAFVLGSLFMGAPTPDHQLEVETWARAKYPELWKELLHTDLQEFENGRREFAIDRKIDP